MKNDPGVWWSAALNPWQGCSRVSEACRECWCLSYLRRFWGQKEGEIRYFLERTEKITTWRKPRHVFVCSLTDVFHEAVPDNMIMDLLNILVWPYSGITHIYYLLTKRPTRLVELLKFKRLDVREIPAHIRLGITIENQFRLEERRPHFMSIPAAIKFLHAEPLLGPLDLSGIIKHVQWVVVGSEQGPKRRPCPTEWIEAVVQQCKAACVPVWVKQTETGKEMGDWPENIRFRERL